MIEIFGIIITAIFVNNIVFAQFLGICPFLGVSTRLKDALGMGMAVTAVMVIATLVTSVLQITILVPYDLGYLQTVLFILVIASIVQMLEIVMKKVAQSLYVALGVFLPLITTNCAVLGVAIMVTQKDMDLTHSVIYAFATALGFTMALAIFAGIREQLNLSQVPQSMKGVPIALITAGILAMAFMGFSGIG
jgi:electron transport complex protein RnfA